MESREAFLADARGRYINGVAAIDQASNVTLETDVIRAAAALASANFQAADIALRLAEAVVASPEPGPDAGQAPRGGL